MSYKKSSQCCTMCQEVSELVSVNNTLQEDKANFDKLSLKNPDMFNKLLFILRKFSSFLQLNDYAIYQLFSDPVNSTLSSSHATCSDKELLSFAQYDELVVEFAKMIRRDHDLG